MKTVLLIEPDTKLAHIYAKNLEQGGYVVTTTHHAQDAIFAADTTRPDVVILELQLAGHSGIEFLYEFRSYAEWQYIPVILLTLTPPRALMITQQLMDSLGIKRCLYKPAVTLKQLRSVVDMVCSEVPVRS